jgi:hypothetical protein
VQAKAKTVCVKRLSDSYFGHRVTPLDTGHHATSRRAVNYVHCAFSG